MFSKSSQSGRLVAVLCLGLVLRVGLALWVSATNPVTLMQPDSFGYRQLGLNLLRYGVFSRSPHPPFEFEIFRAPGYPAFLALVYRLFETGPLPVVLLQALFAGLTCLLTFFIGRRVFTAETGLLAALFVGLDMASVVQASVLMSEVLFGLLLVLGVWLVLRGLAAPAPGKSEVLAGLVFAGAAFVRPLGYYLVPLLGLALFLRHAFRRELRRGLVRAGLFFLVPVVLFGAWQGFRLARTGSARFTQIECLNMFWYRGCGALSLARREPIHALQAELGLDVRSGRLDRWFELHPATRGMSATQLSELWFREGWRLVRRYPLAAALVHLRGLFVQLFDPGAFELARMAGAEDQESGERLHAVLQVAPLALLRYLWHGHRLLLVFSVVGVLWLAFVYTGAIGTLVRRPGFATALLVLVSGYCLVVAAGCEAAARFRVPVMPFVAVLAAQGWRRIFGRCS